MLRRLWVGFVLALPVLAIGLNLFPANSQADDPPAGKKVDLADGTISMLTPENWKEVAPKSTMIQFEFMAPKDAKPEEQARITIMPSGGGVQPNLDRWKGQFELADEADASFEKKEVGSLALHLVDIKGTYKDSAGGPMSGKVIKRERWRMLGVILETKDGELYFIKMTGPVDTVEAQVEGWKKMLDEVKTK